MGIDKAPGNRTAKVKNQETNTHNVFSENLKKGMGIVESLG